MSLTDRHYLSWSHSGPLLEPLTQLPKVLTVGMKHLTGKSHLWGTQWVIKRETQDGRKNTKLKASVFWAPERYKIHRT